MTATLERPSNGSSLALAHAPKPSSGDAALANLTDTARFEQLQRVATMMGSAAFTPAHLKGSTTQQTIANCFRVVNQAMRWGFDPFAVGDETYVVKGKLGYQGKLVAAVINARAGLVGRLRPEYSGKGDDRTVTIIGQFASEDAPRTVDLTLRNARTDNQMWAKDPDQKLWYSGVVKWSRRHCPELILGVMTDDDLERMPDNGQAVSTADIDAEILGDMTKTTATTDHPNNTTFDAAGEEPKKEAAPEKKPLSDEDKLAAQEALDQRSDDLSAAMDDCLSATGAAKIGAELKAAEQELGAERYGKLLAKFQELNRRVGKK